MPLNAVELEARILDIVERATRGQPIEDDRIELKREWPDDKHKAARGIGGLCNASGGDWVLWVVGVDEMAGKVVGASQNNFADWWPQVKSQFDGVAPRVNELAVPVDGGTVVGLMFEPDRKPYVVKNTTQKVFDREVPWREATSTRSAKRHDLLRLLVVESSKLAVDVLHGRFIVAGNGRDFRVSLYVDPGRANVPVAIPSHRCGIECSTCGLVVPSDRIHLRCISPLVESDKPGRELILRGPGTMQIDCKWADPDNVLVPREDLHFRITLNPVRAHQPTQFDFVAEPSGQSDKWEVVRCMDSER